jgi:hypothetical protein
MNLQYKADIAYVTSLGIEFQNAYYSGERAIREQWFYKANTVGEWAIPVLYSKFDNKHLCLCDHGFEICHLIEFRLFGKEELENYHSLIEIYKVSKAKLDKIKRRSKYGYLL